jgi:hypothetical protein
LYATEGTFVFRIDPDGVAVATLIFPGFLPQKQEELFVQGNSLGDNHAGVDRR